MPFQDLGVGFNQSAGGVIKYPVNDKDYLGKLTFQIVNEEVHRVNLGGTLPGLFSSSFGDVLKSFAEGISSVADAFGEGWANGLANTSISPPSRLNDYTTDLSWGKIQLHLPQALRVDDAASYDNNMALGTIGGAVEGALQQGSTAAQAVAKGLGAAGSNVAGLLGGGGKISREAAAIAAQNRAKALGEGASNAISAATGIASNPNTRTIFRSVPIRTFGFQYTLIATSQKEAEDIKKIIKKFREELYPESIVAGGIDYAYRFPRRFIIKASYKNKEWDGIKFLPCYLQSFQAVYNPNGMGMHSDGNFTEVQISMQFSESRALSKSDIKAGF